MDNGVSRDEPAEVAQVVTASRLDWSDVNREVAARLGRELGSPIIAGDGVVSGFSPSFAGKCRLADGREVFIKACDAATNVDTPNTLRSEILVAESVDHPAVPKLLASVDDGDWVALAFEVIDGRHPVQPWSQRDLASACRAVDELSRALTPCPAAITNEVAGLFAQTFDGNTKLRAEGSADLDPWVGDNLDVLVALEQRARDIGDGDSLVHLDLRHDNLLFDGEDNWTVIDWAWGTRGADWIDVVLLVACANVKDGVDRDALLAETVVCRDVPAEDIDAVLGGLLGFFEYQSRQPAPQSIPHLREHQRLSGERVREWLRARLDRG